MGLFTKTKQVDENTYEIDLTNDTVASSDSVKFSNINEGAAKKIVALQSGIDLIGNSISTLPVYLYKRGTITKVRRYSFWCYMGILFLVIFIEKFSITIWNVSIYS